MPTVINVDATWDTTISYDAAELRRADAALFVGDGSSLGVRGGIARHGDNSLAVTVNGSDVVTIQPGSVVIPGNAVASTGVYRSSLSTAVTASIDPRNSTNPRIDLVVFRALDTDIVAGHGANTGHVQIITGTPGASPTAPTLPTMGVELARLNVPAVAGGAVTVDSSYRTYAAALGGRFFVETAARLPGSGNQKGQEAVALDTGSTHRWNGTAWTEPNADTGWVDLGNTVGAGALKYRRRGPHVTVRVIGAAATTSGTTYTISSSPLPTELRPNANTRGACDFSGYPGTMLVLSTGHIQVAQTSGANRAAVEGLVTYPMEA